MPSVHDSEDDNEDHPQSPPPQSRKRALLKALDKKPRKKNKTSPLDQFLKAARWIGRSQDPFINFIAVFLAMYTGEIEENGDSEANESRPENKEQKELARLFNVTMSLIIGFEKQMDEITDSPERLEDLCSRMTTALGAARSDDCGSIKEAGLAYAALELGQQSLTPPIAFKTSKDVSRGFLHPQLGRLLCPAKYLADFDENSADFLQKLRDGRVVVTSRDLPTFLYKNSEYDPEDMDAGLCRSEILVRTWRHIYTSPSSANKNTPGPGRSKSGQAKLNGLDHVTGRTIAYAALHVRWFLCSEDDWRLEDGLFNKEEFFRLIVFLFETETDDEWAKETLEWWDSQVFSAKPVIALSSAASTDDFSALLAQRRARKTQQAGPSSPPAPRDDDEPPPPRMEDVRNRQESGTPQPQPSSSQTLTSSSSPANPHAKPPVKPPAKRRGRR